MSDVKRSAEFYNKLFGTQTMKDIVDDFGPFVVSGSPTLVIGFRTHEATKSADSFDAERIGLDHCAFHVGARSDLDAWESRLDEEGISHSGIVEDASGVHLNFKDPDNIALELFYPAQQG
ncbi:VOC family protein [Streptomyces sp. ISL-87]|nr:VOC family protein [Streptomyces sp. ISL-21]MBT2456649.1 VOC family protein [Streptomyces sp. ISL-86]MBT2612199.1 VOC family protein [Streptomyces sp. ISL-87]